MKHLLYILCLFVLFSFILPDTIKYYSNKGEAAYIYNAQIKATDEEFIYYSKSSSKKVKKISCSDIISIIYETNEPIINCDVLTKEQNKNNKGIYIKKANQGELEYNENRIIVFGIILYLILDAQGVDVKGLFEILN
tara:strand:- start:278 stop:688 length:411 start_codon:yes stop_codon:yes gene_type:complete